MSTRDVMTCAQVHDMAAELALGVLIGRERAAALAHLEGCKACREEVRRLMVVGGRLLELLGAAEPPAGFETRVLERLGMAAPSAS
jgi:anti-sigma factor ChrR (cupin superfamily)